MTWICKKRHAMGTQYLLSLIIGLLLAGLVQAEENRVHRFDDVVVTATRRPVSAGNIHSSVTVIGPEELALSAAKNVDDVLRSHAGLNFWGSDIAYGGFRAATMRGLGGSNNQGRSLILVDGMPINDTWDGNVAWSQIAKEDVERIEIVRGPASALYGGSAMGGVINIITKMPAKKPFGFLAKGGYGSLERFVGYGNISGKLQEGRIGYYLSGKKDINSGYKAVSDYDGEYEADTDRDIDNVMGKLCYFPDANSDITLSASYFSEERNRGFKYSKTNPREVEKLNTTYRRNVSDGLSMLTSIYYQHNDQTTEFDSRDHSSQSGIENYDKPFYGVIFQPSYALTTWNTLTAGFEYKHNELKHHRTSYGRSGTTYQDTLGKQEYFGLYVQDEAFLLNDRLVVSLGGRMDWWHNFDGAYSESGTDDPVDQDYASKHWSSFNPKLGSAFHLSANSTLRGAVGTGYRAPTPARMYANLRRGNRIIEGNPDLDPEKLVSYEIGLDHRFGGFAAIHLTTYYTDAEDLISSRTIIEGELQKYANIGEVSTKGLEIETTFNLHRFWRGYANFTYNESKIEKDEETPDNEGNWLEHSPKITSNFGLTFDCPDWLTATLQARFVDSMYNDNENTEELDSYWTMDFKASRKILDMATLALTLENIFNTKYEWQCYTTVYEGPGILAMLELTVEF